MLDIKATFAICWLSQMVKTFCVDALVKYFPIAARTHDSPRQLLPVLLRHLNRSTHIISLYFNILRLKSLKIN